PAPTSPVAAPPSAPPVAEPPAPAADRQFQAVSAPEPAPPAQSFYVPSAEPPPPSPPPPPAAPPSDFWTTRPSGSLNAPPVEPPRPAEPPHVSRADMSDEEKAHNDARRFARLLVSEIKLYNEQKVAEGRRNSDLYDRLKEDIDRSRQMYEKRITPSVAAKFDYFYDELVNTLAEGDAARLGSDYPGPSVAV
ncbi:MAG TPA: hypothetical protein VKA60_04715, partial [Blastocatellia bacterium]|nr:hypothetical protein [Blastocatellia bacterium]